MIFFYETKFFKEGRSKFFLTEDMKEPLVSIIIPVFNRECLLGETLDSILRQSYSNWECIIVDDGSTDGTKRVAYSYLLKDSRFNFFERPFYKFKGANSCRNYGFLQSKGDFIQWFDSDDIMLKEFLKRKICAISSGPYDYVISKTKNFLHSSSIELERQSANYGFEKYEVSHHNYVHQKINWLTPDFLVRRGLVEKIYFNEKLPSGQEYNFLCKLTLLSTDVIILNEVLAKRRIHGNSIKGRLDNKKTEYLKNKNLIDFENWRDLKKMNVGSCFESTNFFFKKSVENSLNINIPFTTFGICFIANELRKVENIFTAFLYLSFQLIGRVFHRGHFIRKLFKSQWNQH